ncbi:MAG: hypothetical protein LH631_12945 [Alkalinema sp. CAN_BIN05]|nr:hypothetical protein [Alkalinema sp. CAN_BIN05]
MRCFGESSSTRSDRKQFCKRMVNLSQTIGLRMHLIYYPPYHSKYNPIERCWTTLEQYWNGAILNSIEAAIGWASRMAWNGIHPIVHLAEGIYEKGVKVLPELLEACQSSGNGLKSYPNRISPYPSIN